MARPTRRARRQSGFTLVELLLGIVLAAIFAIALYGFFSNGLTQAATHRNQAVAQSEGRRAMDVMTRELRQAVSPDGGATPPIITLTPTSIVFHLDASRVPGNAAPRPQRIRYQITGGSLTREFADPIGSAPPYTYSTYRPPETIVADVRNGATPLFRAFTPEGTALAATIAAPVTADAAQVSVRLIVGYRTGNANSTLELTTDVAPRNPRRAL